MRYLVNKINQRVGQPFMFHYSLWAVWKPLLARPLLQTDALCSQTDAHADANPKLMHFGHKLFADCCTSKKKEILPSRTPSAISFIR